MIQRRAGWWPYGVGSLATVVLRWPTLTNNIFSIDEPDYFAQTRRLATPFAWIYSFYFRTEIKAQVGLIPYWLAAQFGAANAVLVRHWIGLLAVLLAVWLMIAISRRFLGNPWPGVLTSLLWLPYTLVGPGYAFLGHTVLEQYPAPKLEYTQTPALLLGVYALLLALQRSRAGQSAAWPMAGAGLAWALSMLIKPSSIALGPFYLLLVPVALPRTGSRHVWVRRAWGVVGPFLLTSGLLIGAVFVPYLWNPAALDELVFNFTNTAVAYSASGAADLLTRLLALLLTGMPPMLAGVALLAPALVGRYLGRTVSPLVPMGTTLLLGSAGLLILVALAGCVCPHYFPPIIALLYLAVAFCLTPVFQVLWTRGRTRAAWVGGALLIAAALAPQVPALLAFPAQALVDSYRADDIRRFDLDGLLAYVDTHSRPTDPIWVYYDTSEIYLWSERLPATRDPQSNWLTTAWRDPWFARTVTDLAADRPALIIGIDQPRLPRRAAQGLDAIPQVSAWIDAHYHCDRTLVRGTTICAPSP